MTSVDNEGKTSFSWRLRGSGGDFGDSGSIVFRRFELAASQSPLRFAGFDVTGSFRGKINDDDDDDEESSIALTAAKAASSSRFFFFSTASSFAFARFSISSCNIRAKIWASPCNHTSKTPSHSRVGTGKSRLRYTALIDDSSSVLVGGRTLLGGAEADPSSLLETRDRTALENSRTILLVPGTLRLVPTTKSRSAPLRPFEPIRSLLTTSPTPSPFLCASLYNTTLGRSFPIPRSRFPINFRVRS
jgi:hypothetical protein